MIKEKKRTPDGLLLLRGEGKKKTGECLGKGGA